MVVYITLDGAVEQEAATSRSTEHFHQINDTKITLACGIFYNDCKNISKWHKMKMKIDLYHRPAMQNPWAPIPEKTLNTVQQCNTPKASIAVHLVTPLRKAIPRLFLAVQLKIPSQTAIPENVYYGTTHNPVQQWKSPHHLLLCSY